MRRLSIEERARVMRALGTHSRMSILEVLKSGPLDVGDIASRLGISQSAVSQHLKVLKKFELVADERHSYFIAYSLNPLALARLEEIFDAVCRINFENLTIQRKLERRQRLERLIALKERLEHDLERIQSAIVELEREEEQESI